MPIHGSMFQECQETTGQDPFTLQNKKLARTGSMVAYQGDVRFENTGSGGLNKMLKKAVTGEGVNVMQCTGTGELFVADMASEIQVFYLENDTISCNGASILAFSGSIDVSGPPTFADPNAVVLWTSGVQMNIKTDSGGLKSMVRGGTGEMFQMGFSGQGYVMVQPAENVVTTGGQQAGGGGLLGGIMGQ